MKHFTVTRQFLILDMMGDIKIPDFITQDMETENLHRMVKEFFIKTLNILDHEAECLIEHDIKFDQTQSLFWINNHWYLFCILEGCDNKPGYDCLQDGFKAELYQGMYQYNLREIDKED